MTVRGFSTPWLLAGLLVAALPGSGLAQSDSLADGAPQLAGGERRDGGRDFDWEIGTWETRLSRLLHPLTGSDEWIEYVGTTVVRKVWDGRANLVELSVEGPDGPFEGLSLRLYDPRARQWSLHYANAATGALSPPSIGEFRDGRGEFYSQESFNDRTILVKFVISVITPDSVRFEQSFSDDGGRTWELNWIATDTRTVEPAAD
jgi:hypothetical protein